jgi:hypothetical protein
LFVSRSLHSHEAWLMVEGDQILCSNKGRERRSGKQESLYKT